MAWGRRTLAYHWQSQRSAQQWESTEAGGQKPASGQGQTYVLLDPAFVVAREAASLCDERRLGVHVQVVDLQRGSTRAFGGFGWELDEWHEHNDKKRRAGRRTQRGDGICCTTALARHERARRARISTRMRIILPCDAEAAPAASARRAACCACGRSARRADTCPSSGRTGSSPCEVAAVGAVRGSGGSARVLPVGIVQQRVRVVCHSHIVQ